MVEFLVGTYTVDRVSHPFLSDVAKALDNTPEAQVSMALPPFGSDPDAFSISGFEVDSSFRGQGIGSRLLEVIVGLADLHGVTLHVEPSPTRDGVLHFGVAEWCSRTGFVWNDAVHPVAGGQMHRRPDLAPIPRGLGA